MNLELGADALEYGRLSRRALEAAGGDHLVQAAEAEPARREELLTPTLTELGAWELEPRGGADELEAAAALCRSCGYWALPYPVAERISRPAGVEADGLVVVHGPRPAGPVAGLPLRWVAVGLDGRRSRAVPRPGALTPRKTAFVADLELEPLDERGGPDLALGLVLPCWTLLGMLDRTLELTVGYIRQREQFGQPLAAFQGVQFQLTDAEVERTGLEQLARYALWSVQAGLPEAVDDALSLRTAAIEAADVVFRVAHQLHGAIGFCDETTLSWLSRYSVPIRRLPSGLAGSRAELTRRLGRGGLTGLFEGSPAR